MSESEDMHRGGWHWERQVRGRVGMHARRRLGWLSGGLANRRRASGCPASRMAG